MTAAIIAAIRPFLPFFFFPSSTNCICGPACTFSAVCSPHSRFSSPQLQFSPQLQAVSPSALLPESHSTVAPPHFGQKASLSCKIRLQFSHFFIVFLPIFSKIRIQCCNFSRMCRFRNIILQQKIPHVKTFFRPLRFYPFFVRIHHGTVSACIVRTNAQIKTDSFCRPGRNCRQNFVKTLPILLVAFNYVRYRRIPEILRYFPNSTNVAANL